MFNKFLILFVLSYAVILFMVPKELPREILNVSIEGATVQHYQLKQGECSRTMHIMQALLRGLNKTEINVRCIEAAKPIE